MPEAAHQTRLERILGVPLAEGAVRQWPQSGELIESPRPQRQITLPALPRPTFTRIAWFGGLTVAGVAGVLEWPVAVAVGVGSVVAERLAREHGHGPKVT